MFEGLLRDYIQCNECKYTRMRTDVFSDLPLVVRDLNTIYDGLSFFSRPELLSDDNKYVTKKFDFVFCTNKEMTL